MNYWKDNGAPSEKLIVGFPEYGHTFLLSSPSNTGIGAPTSGAGPAGPYTRESGFLAYYEVSRLAVYCYVNFTPNIVHSLQFRIS